MPMSRRSLWILSAVFAAVIVLVWAYLATDRAPAAPEPAPSIAEVSSPDEARSPSPSPPVRPPEAEAQPAAQSAPSAPEQPPSASAGNMEEDEEISPEAPQTPKWRLEKTTLIAVSLGKRVHRLEVAVREAEAKGDRAGAAEQRTLLERSRQRMMEAEREIAALKEQVEGDGG